MPEQAIINAIHSLASEGKPISTATVKARLDSSVSLTTLLAVISRYKQNPQNLPLQTDTAKEAKSASKEAAERALIERIIALEHKVARLEHKVARLEQQQAQAELSSTTKQEPHT
ncbi:hypothetical protein [Oceanisphaera pacifica]|uniref:KfrA N-terminal DNA-binding domain-containing protein n=1 Tax=Oceanisphaera pacifica TaxID=2818389 RepID=A0ABS3NJ54_9GAMM|nr:hypothetical protein [Oceanisphaera pacifica]MBO1520598.1 hypothetical protein [Oceanisphaera pacifica]